MKEIEYRANTEDEVPESIKIVRPIGHLLGYSADGNFWAGHYEEGEYRQTNIVDLRGHNCAICGKPWDLTGEAFRNAWYLHLTGEHAHLSCYGGYLTLKEAETWASLLMASGLACSIKKIPNEYTSHSGSPDWFIISFAGVIPKIKVGQRKRVWHMGLHDLRREQIEAFMEAAVIKNTTNTKGKNAYDVYVHAWNLKEAAQFMEMFVNIIKMDPQAPAPQPRVATVEA